MDGQMGRRVGGWNGWEMEGRMGEEGLGEGGWEGR